MMVEFWRAGGTVGTTSPDLAAQVEASGWDGQMFMDSQSLGMDPYVLMGAWASRTYRLRLSTGVTNPLTRHPAVTAAGAATLQAISAGRAVLGIGRGDSALAYLGYAPVKLELFQRTLGDLQTLLRGQAIRFGEHASVSGASSVETISLGKRPLESKLGWLPTGMAKVPLDVAATGPRVIEISAPIAERVTFSVGAIPDRLRWAIGVADSARRSRDLGREGVSYGAQVIVVCHTDIEAVRQVAESMVVPLARFQVINGKAAGPKGAHDDAHYAEISRHYDMNKHGETDVGDKLGQSSLSTEFVHRFAIVGPPDLCIARLIELGKLGIERFVVVGPGFHAEAGPAGTSLFASEVMPAVRQALSS